MQRPALANGDRCARCPASAGTSAPFQRRRRPRPGSRPPAPRCRGRLVASGLVSKTVSSNRRRAGATSYDRPCGQRRRIQASLPCSASSCPARLRALGLIVIRPDIVARPGSPVSDGSYIRNSNSVRGDLAVQSRWVDDKSVRLFWPPCPSIERHSCVNASMPLSRSSFHRACGLRRSRF